LADLLSRIQVSSKRFFFVAGDKRQTRQAVNLPSGIICNHHCVDILRAWQSPIQPGFDSSNVSPFFDDCNKAKRRIWDIFSDSINVDISAQI
jgi:hypothetical protein